MSHNSYKSKSKIFQPILEECSQAQYFLTTIPNLRVSFHFFCVANIKPAIGRESTAFSPQLVSGGFYYIYVDNWVRSKLEMWMLPYCIWIGKAVGQKGVLPNTLLLKLGFMLEEEAGSTAV